MLTATLLLAILAAPLLPPKPAPPERDWIEPEAGGAPPWQPEPLPPLTDLDSFPDGPAARAMADWYRAQDDAAWGQSLLDPTRQGEWFEYRGELRRRRALWELLAGAQEPCVGVRTRRQLLGELRRRLKPAAYAGGMMPGME